MKNLANCLKEAMHFASESYSGSAYEASPMATNEDCDEGESYAQPVLTYTYDIV